jgi:hypothetical protein
MNSLAGGGGSGESVSQKGIFSLLCGSRSKLAKNAAAGGKETKGGLSDVESPSSAEEEAMGRLHTTASNKKKGTARDAPISMSLSSSSSASSTTTTAALQTTRMHLKRTTIPANVNLDVRSISEMVAEFPHILPDQLPQQQQQQSTGKSGGGNNRKRKRGTLAAASGTSIAAAEAGLEEFADESDVGAVTSSSSSSSSSGGATNFYSWPATGGALDRTENPLAIPALHQLFAAHAAALPHPMFALHGAKAPAPAELAQMLRERKFVKLESFDAFHENELLVEAGKPRRLPSGQKAMPPSCKMGAKCEGLQGQIRGVDGPGFILTAYMFREELAEFLATGVAPRGHPRPCILCSRIAFMDVGKLVTPVSLSRVCMGAGDCWIDGTPHVGDGGCGLHFPDVSQPGVWSWCLQAFCAARSTTGRVDGVCGSGGDARAAPAALDL